MNHMKLTEEHINKIEDKVRKNLNETNCEVCGNKNWLLQDSILYLQKLVSDDEAVPIVSFSCDNCGNAKMFNAFTLGLLPSK